MKRHKAVVLGAGPRGRAHVSAFLQNSERFELTAVCDADVDRMSDALDEMGVKLPVYDNAEKMLEEEKPDVFCFATQPDARLGLVRAALKRGVRAIAYEKPMALSLAEAELICTECNQAEVKQIVCHQHKYGEHWKKAKEIIDAGGIGKIESIHATSKGWFYYFITHLVDYSMWLIGYPDPLWMSGSLRGRSMLLDSHPSPDYVAGRIAFSDGVHALFECGPLAPGRGVDDRFWYDAGVTVYGTKGSVEVVVGRGWRAITDSGIYEDRSISLDEAGDTVPYITELAEWLDDEKAIHPCNGELSFMGFQVSMGIMVSGLEGRIVTFPVDRSVPVVERMRMELPFDQYTDGIHQAVLKRGVWE